MYVVISQLGLSVAIDSIIHSIEQELADAFGGLPGFEGYQLVQSDANDVTLLTYWDSSDHAAETASVIQPGSNKRHLSSLVGSVRELSSGELVLQRMQAAGQRR